MILFISKIAIIAKIYILANALNFFLLIKNFFLCIQNNDI